jgi:predicted DNA-binding protein YlxM (UPF0122 family)
MEAFVEKTLLYDFYGELLTEHQREIYEDVVLNDYSVSEVAAELGISRQGVHDQLRRVDKLLAGYEERLLLVKRFLDLKEKVSRIRDTVSACNGENLAEVKKTVAEISDSILEEL